MVPVGSLEKCTVQVSGLRVEVRDRIVAVRDCNGSILDCNGTVRDCIDSILDCNGAVRDCIDSILDCNGAVRDCIDSISDCNGAVRDCIDSISDRGRGDGNAPALLREGFSALSDHLNHTKERRTLKMAEITKMPSPHAEGAKELLDKIRALEAAIPRFAGPSTVDARRLSSLMGIPDAFMESAGVAVQKSSRLEQAAGVDSSTLRDSFGYAISYDAVVQALRALADAMANSIRVQRAEAAASALDVYAIAQRISKQKDGAELRPHVEDMRRKLSRKRSRKTTAQPDPALAVTTTPSKKV